MRHQCKVDELDSQIRQHYNVQYLCLIMFLGKPPVLLRVFSCCLYITEICSRCIFTSFLAMVLFSLPHTPSLPPLCDSLLPPPPLLCAPLTPSPPLSVTLSYPLPLSVTLLPTPPLPTPLSVTLTYPPPHPPLCDPLLPPPPLCDPGLPHSPPPSL